MKKKKNIQELIGSLVLIIPVICYKIARGAMPAYVITIVFKTVAHELPTFFNVITGCLIFVSFIGGTCYELYKMFNTKL